MKWLWCAVACIALFILAVVLALVLSAPAQADDSHHGCQHSHNGCGEQTQPEPTPSPAPAPVYVTNKTVRVSVPALLLGIAGGVCIYKRFWLDDPCIGKPAHKTSAADDQVVPVIPTGRLYQ